MSGGVIKISSLKIGYVMHNKYSLIFNGPMIKWLPMSFFLMHPFPEVVGSNLPCAIIFFWPLCGFPCSFNFPNSLFFGIILHAVTPQIQPISN